MFKPVTLTLALLPFHQLILLMVSIGFTSYTLATEIKSFQIVSGATRYPMNVGSMEEAIIVGVSYATNSKRDNSRVLDYTPTSNKAWRQKTGGAAQYLLFHKPIIKRLFQQRQSMDCTGS